MDSLIVFRKPLRKSLLAPTFIIPKKSKKALIKVDPIPPDPNSAADSSERPISFVKLYKDLCVENTRRSARVHVRDPARAHATSLASRSPASRSDTSLVTQYRGNFGADVDRVIYDSLPPVTARAELLLELDYGTNSTLSEFS